MQPQDGGSGHRDDLVPRNGVDWLWRRLSLVDAERTLHAFVQPPYRRHGTWQPPRREPPGAGAEGAARIALRPNGAAANAERTPTPDSSVPRDAKIAVGRTSARRSVVGGPF